MDMFTARGRDYRLVTIFLLTALLLISLAPASLAAAPDLPAAPTATDEGDPAGLWVEPTRPMSWEVARPAPAPAAEPMPASISIRPSPLVMCGATGSDISITSGTLASVVECTLTAPVAGAIYVAANATASAETADVEGSFRIAVDGGAWPFDRSVSVYTSSAQVQHKVATINALQGVGPGSHTISFQARRSAGTGSLRLTLPAVSAIFVPGTGSFRTCNNAVDGSWTTTSTGSQPVVSCDVSAPSGGYLFYAVNGWFTNSNGAYQAFYRVQHDNQDPLPPGSEDNTYRRQDVYDDSLGGGDDTFSVTGIRWVDPGTRTTTLRVGKWGGSGPGTVTLNDATVSAFFFTPGEAQAQVCSDLVSESWYTTYQTYYAARWCDLTQPLAGQVFVSADGYAGELPSLNPPLPIGPYEMGSRLGFDSESGLPSTERVINVVNDARDRSDEGFANVAIQPLSTGLHTLYWSAALKSNPAAGTAAVYRVGLTAIATFELPDLPNKTYLPLITR